MVLELNTSELSEIDKSKEYYGTFHVNQLKYLCQYLKKDIIDNFSKKSLIKILDIGYGDDETIPIFILSELKDYFPEKEFFYKGYEYMDSFEIDLSDKYDEIERIICYIRENKINSKIDIRFRKIAPLCNNDKITDSFVTEHPEEVFDIFLSLELGQTFFIPHWKRFDDIVSYRDYRSEEVKSALNEYNNLNKVELKKENNVNKLFDALKSPTFDDRISPNLKNYYFRFLKSIFSQERVLFYEITNQSFSLNKFDKTICKRDTSSVDKFNVDYAREEKCLRFMAEPLWLNMNLEFQKALKSYNEIFKQKYLKYKNKYLNLQKNIKTVN